MKRRREQRRAALVPRALACAPIESPHTADAHRLQAVSLPRTSRTASAGATKVCIRDESRTAFRPTESITCSALFVGGKGKLAGIAFLREGKPAADLDFELPLPITAAGPRLDPDPKLASGDWACRWSLDGRVLATKQFRIAG